VKFRLGEADSQRYGLDPQAWLEFDGRVLMQTEAEILQQAIPGFDPDDWFEFLEGEDTGAVDPDGKPIRRRHPQQLRVVIWCTLRRAGTAVAFSELDFDRRAVLMLVDPAVVDAAAAATAEAGASGGKARRRRSTRSATSSS
jgi:hypothetical protein